MASKLTNMATQRASGGYSVSTLAKKANVADRTIVTLENGGTVNPHIAQRIADALGVSLVTLGQGDI